MQGQCWGQCQRKPAWEPVIWKNRRRADQTKVKLSLFPLWSFCLTSWVQCKVCVWFASLFVFLWWNPKRNSYLIWTTSPPLMSWKLVTSTVFKFDMFVYVATNVRPGDVLATNTLARGLDVFMLRAKMCSLDAKQLRNVQIVWEYVCVSAQVVSSPNRKQAHLHEHHQAVRWYNMTW